MQNPSGEPAPNLGGLEGTYQILTELHATPAAQTYLARHLSLNRDVTISVFRAAAYDRAALERLEADARTLTTLRHETLIPVIEGRWLDGGDFALVRARIRGSTLDQVMSAVGPMPTERVAASLGQVNAALVFAREHGIAERDVTADDVVFQQGTGRAMVAFDPVPRATAAASDACMDARTIGRLATEMLTGQRMGAAGAPSLAAARPDLSPDVVQRTNALAACTGSVVPDIPAYLALLDPASRVARAPVVAGSNDAVVVVNRSSGYGARFATAVLVVVVLAALGFFWLHNRQENANRVAVAPVTPTDTNSLSSGDVTSEAPTPAPGLPPGYPMIVGSTTPTPTPEQPVYVPPSQPMPQPMPSQPMPAQPMPAQPMPAQSMPSQPAQPAAPAQSAPPASTPVTTAPATSTQPPVMKVDSTPRPASSDTVASASGDVCSSPATSDQRTCFSNAVARSDAELTRVYNDVISSLRKQAGAQTTDPDPASVTHLRSAEWSWLDKRDAACRGAGSPPLYAQARAQCYADQTASRIAALKQMLSSVPDSTGTP